MFISLLTTLFRLNRVAANSKWLILLFPSTTNANAVIFGYENETVFTHLIFLNPGIKINGASGRAAETGDAARNLATSSCSRTVSVHRPIGAHCGRRVDDAMKTLVHAFIISRVDYCNAVLAGSPKTTTDTLQRVLNAAARLVTNTDMYDCGLSSRLNDQLHWLNVPERIE